MTIVDEMVQMLLKQCANSVPTVFQQCSNSVLTPVSARCWHVLTPVSAQVLEQISGDSRANVGTQTLAEGMRKVIAGEWGEVQHTPGMLQVVTE